MRIARPLIHILSAAIAYLAFAAMLIVQAVIFLEVIEGRLYPGQMLRLQTWLAVSMVVYGTLSSLIAPAIFIGFYAGSAAVSLDRTTHRLKPKRMIVAGLTCGGVVAALVLVPLLFAWWGGGKGLAGTVLRGAATVVILSVAGMIAWWVAARFNNGLNRLAERLMDGRTARLVL